jgi:nucleotide-binding universal stress UspA family protein
MFTTILVPVDGSKNADRALDAAIQLARLGDGSILLLHVIRRWALPKEIIAMIQAGEVTESRLEIMQDSAEIILSSARKRCEDAGLSVAAAEYVSGDPAKQIAAYASAHEADLIVIGHSGLEADVHPRSLQRANFKSPFVAS